MKVSKIAVGDVKSALELKRLVESGKVDYIDVGGGRLYIVVVEGEEHHHINVSLENGWTAIVTLHHGNVVVWGGILDRLYCPAHINVDKQAKRVEIILPKQLFSPP